MEVQKISKGTIFTNSLFEAFSKTSPRTALLFYISVVIFFIWINLIQNLLWVKWIFVFSAGVFFWTLFEYLMHRYLFHYLSTSERGKRFNYMIHGIHHEFPHDKERLFMPPLPGSIIIALLFGLFYLLINHYVYSFMAGMISGYLVYVSIHFLIHTRKSFRGFKKLWRHHSLHHYKYPDKAFGVSSFLWDMIFGSMPPTNQKKQN